MPYEKNKEIVTKAVEILNERKGTDLKIELIEPHDDREGVVVHLFSPTKFTKAVVKNLELLTFAANWFDPDGAIMVDGHTDYGELEGDQKVLARMIFAIYVIWLGDGSFYHGKDLMKAKKKASE